MKTLNTLVAIALGSGTFFVSGLIGTMGHGHAAAVVGHQHLEPMHVTKTPTCGCCGSWVALAREHGFEVTVTDTEDYAAMKSDAGVPDALQACHTTTVGGYVVEGHVPFAAIDKLLDEKPDIAGISVPGMPMGSPGMGDDPTAVYDVLAYGKMAGDGTLFFTAGRGNSEVVD